MTEDSRQTFSLSDEQWKEIRKCLALPGEARTDLDFSIHAYREQQLLWHDAPSEVRKKLKDTSAAALRLLELLDGLRKREHIDLVEVGYGTARLAGATGEVGALAKACADASTQVSDVRWTFWNDWLIDDLDRILWKFVGLRASRSKAVLDFLKAVCRIAHPEFGPGAVVSAVARFKLPVRSRSEFFLKPDTESRR